MGKPFYYMAAYQIFTGLYGKVLPRLGVYPVDRESSDLKAFKASIKILEEGKNPLVVFPEGEIYRLSDRVAPIWEGTASLAVSALRKIEDASRTIWIVPVGIKYRFIESEDPLPWLLKLMDDLEARFNWKSRADHFIVERIYRYAGAMLALKEIEYKGETRTGDLKPRIASIREQILENLEDRLLGRRSTDHVPSRVKDLRKACLDRIAKAGASDQEKQNARRDLGDLFFVMQTFTYPGDYVRESPTRERIAEILLKFEEDVLGVDEAQPRTFRNAVLQVGEPMNVRTYLSSSEKPRQSVGAITSELHKRIQALVEGLGQGPLLKPLEPVESVLPGPALVQQSS